MSDEEDHITKADPFDDATERQWIRREVQFSQSARPFLQPIVAIMANRRVVAVIFATVAVILTWLNGPALDEALTILRGGGQ